jgi:uncharacterized protein YbjT (DUF2867 family)
MVKKRKERASVKALIFGATGMVGQGVLRECLLEPEMELVRTIGRSPTGIQNPKLSELAHPDLWNYSAIEDRLAGFDACFFCLGVSSAGMKEEAYRRVTYELTMAAAEALSRLNPQMTFVYVSGAGADSTERGRTMWARIKGKTENALLRMPFKGAYIFRPGFIQPLHGARSRTAAYRIIYALLKPIVPWLQRSFPDSVLTTEQIGRAMIALARRGATKRILEAKDIAAIDIPAPHA